MSIGKSAERWKPKAVQQSAKQLPQSARRADRSVVVMEWSSSGGRDGVPGAGNS